MSPAEMWSLVVGFVSATFILPIIQQPQWSDLVRSAVAFGYCVVAGLGTAWLTGELDGRTVNDARSVAGTVLVVFVSAIATYKGFAKPSGLASALENASSGYKAAPGQPPDRRDPGIGPAVLAPQRAELIHRRRSPRWWWS